MKKIISTNQLFIYLSIIIFFALFLCTGIKIFDDFGPVSEERNQIDAGHIVWAYITGDNSHFPDLPPLEEYMNRYYGQGATFITVLIEALFGFRWDVNRVWKIRRLWNFLCFFAAVTCVFWLVKKRYKSYLPAFLAAANLIFVPRMFPEVFYNDRDPLFLSWLVFSFCAMRLFLQKTGWLTSILFGIVLAITINIRMFGFMLIIPLILILIKYPAKRRWVITVILFFALSWYALSPIAWKDPFGTIVTSIVHLTTKQRMIDTQGSTTLLFAGKYFPEQALPWYYLPLWILISTPITLLCLFVFGGISCFTKKGNHNKADPFWTIMDYSLAAFFVLFIVGIPIIRPTLYSGWRHFYFLNLSFVWFAVYGLDRLLKSHNKWLKSLALALEAASLLVTAAGMIHAHPYEGIYYNILFRNSAADNFERDMGYTSTLECLEYLADHSPDQKIEVMNANAFIPFSLIGLSKPVRERFSTIDWKTQRVPMKYIIFNYNNQQGNSQSFPYYAPVYSIEQNGTKLAEIFERTNNKLLEPEQCVDDIYSSHNNDNIQIILSKDKDEIWTGAEQHTSNETLTITMKDGIRLESIEIFPGDYAEASEKLRFYTKINVNSDWEELPVEKNGTNGWLINHQPCKYLQIQSAAETDQPWQIRQILFYGE